jgi:Zinc carboxypeptidase
VATLPVGRRVRASAASVLSGRHLGAAALALLLAPAALPAQTTRAERTAYRETSTYAEVLGFLDSLRARGARFTLDTLAVTTTGRAVPWVLVSRPLVGGPAEAHRSGKPVVYLQANIHAGEVEGKEVAQMLLRDLTLGPAAALLDSLVLLVVPIYNADGNEAVAAGEVNRPGQNGPARVGRRANAQGLDLNRDYVKLEAPETRGSAALLTRWRPHLFVDLHTTNGSYHGYALTWSPGLNPNSTPANEWVRDSLLPTVSARMRERRGRATFPYGNFLNQHPDSLILGWATYDARPRFGTNWYALRGGMAVLSEAYSNDDFATRVASTYDFVRELLSEVASSRDAVRRLARPAPRPDSVAVRSAMGPPTPGRVIAEITEPAGQGNGGYARRRRTGVFRAIAMPVYDRFVAARKEALPDAYLVPERLAGVVEHLRRQGIEVRQSPGRAPGGLERFMVDSVRREPLFEGHRPLAVEGRWTPHDGAPASGWYEVPTTQPLGLLAAYLLEPASEDGVVTWNLLDAELSPGRPYPILRSRTAAATAAQPGRTHDSGR